MVFIAVLEKSSMAHPQTPQSSIAIHIFLSVLTIQGKRPFANNINAIVRWFKQQFPLPLEEPLKPMQILSGSSLPLGIGFSLHEPLKEKSTPVPELPFHRTWQPIREGG